jgi:uncharacterized repeat protein (TIGR03837 family)
VGSASLIGGDFPRFDNPSMPLQRWDIFCRVIDNFGDVGVCWRLARELAQRGLLVRLVLDDPSALTWMAPQGAVGVQVLPWPGPADVADVVIEAFGCDPPHAYVQAMHTHMPVWVNLEYLSAEAYVDRSHGLPSPQPGGLNKWFFYPGFTPRTGGLLREAALVQQREHFDRHAWLARQQIQLHPGERLVSLFCYDNPALPALLHSLAQQPTLLLLTRGHAQRLVTQAQSPLRLAALPWLSQDSFDHLLWACDINLVRGEDSLVRAIWAGQPFIWQAYPQQDATHHAKVQAMLDNAQLPAAVAQVWRAWNGLPGVAWAGLPDSADWAEATRAWRQRLLALPDLATQLITFVKQAGRGKP